MAEPSLVRVYRKNLVVGGVNAIIRGAREAIAEELPNTLRILADSFSQRALPREKMKEINYGIARDAKQVVAAGWKSRLPRGNSGGEFSGTLETALESDAMLSGTSDRLISFANIDLLNRSAKHWYRINYGAAGPRHHVGFTGGAGFEAQSFTVNINGRPFVVLRDDAAPAAFSYLPRVFEWMGNNEMRVIRGPAKPPTGKGSRAAHFLDLGLDVVAREFGPRYDQFLRAWIQDPVHLQRLAKRGIVTSNLYLDAYGYHVTVS